MVLNFTIHVLFYFFAEVEDLKILEEGLSQTKNEFETKNQDLKEQVDDLNNVNDAMQCMLYFPFFPLFWFDVLFSTLKNAEFFPFVLSLT